MVKRGKNKYKTEYKLIDCYEQYVKDSYIKQFKSAYLDSTTSTTVPYKVYKKVLDSFFKMVIDSIIENSVIYKMPLRFGELRVEKMKMPIGYLHEKKNLKIDFGTFRKTGKKVYHLNEHRGGCRYKIKWDKTDSGPVIYKHVYRFVPTRAAKRRLAWILKNDFSRDYLECT
jgi:hypothetical protein